MPSRPRPAPVEDSWIALLRDLLLRGIALGAVVGGGLWLAELPAVRQLPGASWLPRLSQMHAFAALPHAAQVFGIAEPVAAVPVRRPRPLAARQRPVAASVPVPPPIAQQPPTAAPVKLAARVPTPQPVVAQPPTAEPAAAPPRTTATQGGVRLAARKVAGVPLQVVSVDLTDPTVIGTIALANGAPHPNTGESSFGDEEFTALVARARAAAAINGTFFSKDAQKRVMGNMVVGGTLLKYSQWDHDGTTFWLGAGNHPGMATAHTEPVPAWDAPWLSLTCGPRLVRQGEVAVSAALEGFHDAHVLGVAGRSALGFDRSGRWLYLVSFDGAVALEKEAEVMRTLGCAEAMNLDGGASRSLALGNHVVVPAGRPLTNVLVFYARGYPAPAKLANAFAKFGAKP